MRAGRTYAIEHGSPLKRSERIFKINSQVLLSIADPPVTLERIVGNMKMQMAATILVLFSCFNEIFSDL
jgi:hypothetical protein